MFQIEKHFMERSKKIIGLIKSAIKNKQTINSLLEEKGLDASYISVFIRQTPPSTNKKDILEIKSLYKKHQELMTSLKGPNALSESELEQVKKIYYDKSLTWDDRMALLIKKFGKSERTIRTWLVKLGLKEKVVEESAEFQAAQSKIFDKSKKRFIITWAQNETEVHQPFLSNIEAYAKHINASIHVIAGRYRNPTSLSASDAAEQTESWDKSVVKYLDANRHDIHQYMSILSDVKVQPTAVNPMTGLESITGISSCVVGHPRLQMQVIPALEGHKPKVMLSTGSVTKKNYTDSKSGKKGEFHHTYGFVVIEIKNDKTFFARQVTADSNGDFCDLNNKVTKTKITKLNKIAAFIAGDIHYGEHDDQAMSATNDMIKKLAPKEIFLHDVFDGHSISHHDMKNPFKLYQKEQNGSNSLKNEMEKMVDWLEKLQKNNVDKKIIVVRSNHDDFVDRWLQSLDWKRDLKNAAEYIQYAGILLSGEAPKGIVPYIINKRIPKIVCLGRDESYKVLGWELGQHGDYGTNGSRGSLEQFRKLNTRIVVGHYHTPGRKDGALSVGTLTKLRVGYNSGGSSWLHSNVIIHENGKGQHVNIIDGEYTTLK